MSTKFTAAFPLLSLLCCAVFLAFKFDSFLIQPVNAQTPMPAPSFRRANSAPSPVSDPAQPTDSRPEKGRLLYGQAGFSKVLTGAEQDNSGAQAGAQAGSTELQLRLPRSDTALQSKTPFQINAERLSDFVEQNQEPMFAAKVSETARVLSRYDVELIVDASMSMRRPDCPGLMSRWGWCGSQSVDLARQLAPFAGQGITLTSFNRNFFVYEHQSPQQITTLFARTPLALNTRLAEPLADRLNDYLMNSRRDGSKPRLIAVITDGVPHPREQVQMVKDVLIHASNMIKDPRELTVVFLQIGGRDFMGQQFLAEIDNNLVANGAHFDIVQTVSFEHLRKVGLAQGLADAIKTFDYRARY